MEQLHGTEEGAARRVGRRYWLSLGGIVVLATLLRVPGLGRDGMWADECATANWASLSWRGTLAAAASDNHAPLYYLLAKLPVAVLGPSEAAWRLLPALLGILTVWTAAAVGRRLLSPGAGLVAAFLLAISPVHVYYSRQARNYALLMLLVLLAFAAAARVRARGRPGDVALLAAIVAAALYTHTLAALAAIGIVTAWAVFPFDRRAGVRLVAAGMLAGALFAPWLPQVLRQEGRAGESYAWHAADFAREFPWQVPRSLAALSHGSLAPIRNRVADLLPSAWAAAGLVALLAVLAAVRRKGFAVESVPLRLVVAVLVPLLLLFAVASLGPPVYVVGRADVLVAPLLLLLAAAGVAALPSATVRGLAVIAFAGLALLPLRVIARVDTTSQEKLIAGVLRRDRGPGEPVVATGMLPCLQFYAGLVPGAELLAFPARPAPTADWVDWRAHPRDRWPAEAADAVARAGRDASRHHASRVWVVCSRDPVGHALAAAFDARLPLLGALNLHYGGMELRAYALPGRSAPAR